MSDITVSELKSRIDQGNAPIMIDVRQPHEWEMQHLEGVEKIALGTFAAPEVQEKLKGYGEQEVVFICRSGGRSGQATAFSRGRLGVTNARNLAGGMLAWKAEIDPAFNVE